MSEFDQCRFETFMNRLSARADHVVGVFVDELFGIDIRTGVIGIGVRAVILNAWLPRTVPQITAPSPTIPAAIQMSLWKPPIRVARRRRGTLRGGRRLRSTARSGEARPIAGRPASLFLNSPG